MICLICRRAVKGAVCAACRSALRPAPERFVPGAGVVRAAFAHQQTARILVHHLKYRGVIAAGTFLAEAMAPLVPPGTVIVPVPRVRWRLLRYGVDPAVELAGQLARLTGQPDARLLAAPWLGRARAGRAHGLAPAFSTTTPNPPGRLVLVDDVVTTGSTLAAAARVLDGTVAAVTATAAVSSVTEVTSLLPAPLSQVWR